MTEMKKLLEKRNTKFALLSILITIAGFFVTIIFSSKTSQSNPDLHYYQAKVESISSSTNPVVLFLNGPKAAQTETIIPDNDIHFYRNYSQVNIGDIVVIEENRMQVNELSIYDHVRVPGLFWAILLFFLLVIYFTGRKGLKAILSLIVTLLIVFLFLLPQIAAGKPALLVCSFSAIVILVQSMYLTHGKNSVTNSALLASFASIALASIIGVILISITQLFGTSSEESLILSLGNLSNVNFQGLVLGAMILSSVGLIDDVTIVQAVTVKELKLNNPDETEEKIYQKAMNVGKEHILSMVNTLLMTYMGIALPLLLFTFYQESSPIPLWVSLNEEAVAEEIIRTIVGSFALVIAIPLSTYIASRNKKL